MVETYFAALNRPELAFKLMIQAVLDPVMQINIGNLDLGWLTYQL